VEYFCILGHRDHRKPIDEFAIRGLRKREHIVKEW
jgi:hypothetical protein